MNNIVWKVALKTTIGVLIAYIVGLFLPSPFQEWMIITVIIVMTTQISLGSVKTKSTFRMIATAIAVIIGVVAIIIFKNNRIYLTIVILATVFGFTYFSNYNKSKSYIGVVGAFTIGIALAHKDPSIMFAINRGLEVAFGILISFAVEYTIFPIKAINLYKNELKKCVGNIIKIVDEKQKNIIEYDFFASFAKQKQLVKEIKVEMKKNNKEYISKECETISINMRYLFRYIYVLQDYLEYKENSGNLTEENKIEIRRILFEELEKIKENINSHKSISNIELKKAISLEYVKNSLYLNFTISKLENSIELITSSIKKLQIIK